MYVCVFVSPEFIGKTMSNIFEGLIVLQLLTCPGTS